MEIWRRSQSEDFKGERHHNGNGPSIIWGDGEKQWHFQGKMDRIGGPFVVRPNGEKGLTGLKNNHLKSL